MPTVEELDDAAYEELLRPVWRYLAVENEPAPSDVIFVFGGLDMAIPAYATELYKAGYAPHILISGSAGPYTQDVFKKAEAYVFMEEMLKEGVPESAFIIEDKASNALQNVIFGMAALKEHGVKVRKAILVAKPFMMRRSLATFQKQFPEVELLSCPPRGSVIKFIDRARPVFAGRLLHELARLKTYSDKGDIAEQPLPPSVQAAADDLKRRLEQS